MELILFATIGLCFGSFLNVVIVRLPKGQSVSLPASHCPTCKESLKWYHNIPLFSWLFLRGKCAFCKEPISSMYPLVEVATCSVFVLSYLKSDSIFQGAVLSLLFALLFALSMIDFKYKAVPDALSFPALGLSILTGDIILSVQNALIFAGGFALLRMIVSSITKKEAMGEADIIIAGVIGAVCGIKLGLFAIYLGALITIPAFLIVRKKGFELPFIPFLSLGLFLTWAYETEILKWVENIYG